MQVNDRVLTLVEAAGVLRTPIETMRHWRKVGKGPRGFKVGRRLCYRQSDVLAWLQEQYRSEIA